MDAMLRNQFIRTILALCRFASCASSAEDIREDISGKCTDALELWIGTVSGTRPQHLRRWCDDVEASLAPLREQSGIDQAPLVRAHVAVLRLRAQLPQEEKQSSHGSPHVDTDTVQSEKRKPIESRARVLSAITATPDIRTRELVTELRGTVAERTIKRALADLVSDGFIVRVEHEDRTVSYRPSK